MKVEMEFLVIMVLLKVNKDKCQALVEFLTPEDASTALSFDGRSFNGNILKIRRPKDYVEATVFRQLLFSCRLVC